LFVTDSLLVVESSRVLGLSESDSVDGIPIAAFGIELGGESAPEFSEGTLEL